MAGRLFFPTARETNLILTVAFLSFGYAGYMRYLVVEQSSVGLACEGGLATWLCASRAVVIWLFNNNVFGLVGLAAAVLHVLRPSLGLFCIALSAAALGVVLYNTGLSSLALSLLILGSARPRAPAG